MIAFYDGKTEKLIGTVKLVDGKLVASDPSLDDYAGSNPEMFFNQFSNWDNGYAFSIEIPDDQEAPEQAEVEHYSKTWTAEEVQNAQKQ